MTDTEAEPVNEDDRCEECNELPELTDEEWETPLDTVTWERYECPCGHTTVKVPA